jgi:hypothetical protein
MSWNAVWGRMRTLAKQGKDKFNELDKKYQLKTRWDGLSRATTGAGIVTASLPFCAASEAVLPAVVCVAGVYKGTDDIVSGSMQAVTGQTTPTNASQVASSATKAAGGSDQLADAVAKGTEAPEELLSAKKNAERAMKTGARVKVPFSTTTS